MSFGVTVLLEMVIVVVATGVVLGLAGVEELELQAAAAASAAAMNRRVMRMLLLD